MYLSEKEKLNMSRKAYQEVQQRIMELPEKERKLFDSINAVDIGNYDVKTTTMLMITNVYQNNALDSFNTVFKLGFLKGQRAAKAMMKKKKERRIC